MQDTIYHMTLCRKMAAHVNSKVSGICAVPPEPCYLLTEIVGQRKLSAKENFCDMLRVSACTLFLHRSSYDLYKDFLFMITIVLSDMSSYDKNIWEIACRSIIFITPVCKLRHIVCNLVVSLQSHRAC